MYASTTFEQLAQWTQGELSPKGNARIPVVTISTDTRTLKPGDVYLALKGESFDGNRFVKEAVTAGAIGVICESAEELDVPKIKVRDSLEALIAIGESIRHLFTGPVLAITGSAGKSSTKDMVATLLGKDTVSSPASFNNLMGVSRTLCLVNDKTQNLVLEMGMNNFGEIAELCQRFRPQFGMITNIGDAHIGKLGGQEGIYRAKKEMFEFLAKDSKSRGIALNADDLWVMEAYKSLFQLNSKTNFGLKTYSLKQKTADVFLENGFMDPETGFLNLRIKISSEQISAALPIFGEHHAQNIIAAIAMVQLLEVSVEQIKARLVNIRPASHRGEVIQLSQDKILIDETYNSNPKALISSLDSLKKLAPKRRKVLVIGEMRELGGFSEKLHEQVGDYLADWLNVDNPAIELITVEGDAYKIAERVKQRCPQTLTSHLPSIQEARAKVPELIRGGDIIFLKGSRGVKLDQLLSVLK